MYQGRVLEDTESLQEIAEGRVLELQLMLQAQRVEFIYEPVLVQASEAFADCKRMHFSMWGPPGAGKTSILHRCSENFFLPQHHVTIGIDFKKVRVLVDDAPLEIILWDAPAGKERFQTLRSLYLRGKVAIFLILDLTSSEPFWQTERMIEKIDDASIPTRVMIGNKVDLESERQLSREDAERFAEERGFHYFETSARDGTGIEAFQGVWVPCI